MNKLLWLLILFVFTSCSHIKTIQQKSDGKLSILQGLTSAKEVEFSIMAPLGDELVFEMRSAEGDIISPEETKKINRHFSKWAIHKVLFLKDPSKDYNLYVYLKGKVIDQRLVGKGQLNQSNLKLAVTSCMDDYYQDHLKIWEQLAKKNPEYLLMIGDNVYADHEANGTKISSTPESLWKRYTEIRQTLPIFFEQKLIPTHALWDDHDMGENDGNMTFKYLNESREVFDAFFAQSLSNDDYAKGYGVGGELSLGDFNLYFLDGRSYRSPEKDGSHIGPEQFNWLLKNLKDEVQPSFIIKGDQFFGGYHSFESYEGNHPTEFDKFVTELRKIDTPFNFISGDRHMSEIMQFPRSLFGLPSFEITSSPIHGRTIPGAPDKNPWRVVSVSGLVNFVMIDNVAKDNHWFMDVESIGENGEVLFRRELAVFIKDLQNNLNEVRKRRTGRRRYQRSRRRRR